MTLPKPTTEEAFIVKESISINLIAGGVLFAVFFVSMLSDESSWGTFLSALSLLILPAGFYLARARRNAILIKINKEGFYHHGKLIMDWKDFIDAVITHQLVPGSIKDNYVLLLRYYNSDRTLIYTHPIPMASTQDKSEEEIIAAIDHYYKASLCNPKSNPLPNVATW